MSIVSESQGVFRFKLSRRFMEFMAEHHIKTTYLEGPSRWKVDDEIIAAKSLTLYPHTAILRGNALAGLGCFSYSQSALHIHMTVGRYCSISWNVRRMGPPHPTTYLSSSSAIFSLGNPFAESIRVMNPDAKLLPLDWTGGGPARVGNDVWIGQDVLLGNKARLGDGCVVAAGAVVTGEVPPYAIVGGVPARIIRYRFPPDVIADLLDLRWWDYALPNLMHLPVSDPAAFIPAMRQAIEDGSVKPYAPQLGLAYDVIQREI